MSLNAWRKEIDDHYILLQTRLKNIRGSLFYKSFEKEIELNNKMGNYDIVIKLNDILEDHYNLSDIYNQFKWLRNERIEWLREFTGNNNVKNNEYYAHMAYKMIHEGVMTNGLKSLIVHNSQDHISLARNKYKGCLL